jgi:hypothetical protein
LLPPVSRLIARLPSIGEEPKANAGKASMSTDVHAGRDGWLFLIGGSIKVTTLYDRQSRLSSDAKLHHWVKLIEARARRLQGMGIQYIHLNVPEKLTIYDHQLADPPIVDWRLSPAVRLQEMLQQSPHAHVWLDLVAPLRAARDCEPLYFKTIPIGPRRAALLPMA